MVDSPVAKPPRSPPPHDPPREDLVLGSLIYERCRTFFDQSSLHNKSNPTLLPAALQHRGPTHHLPLPHFGASRSPPRDTLCHRPETPTKLRHPPPFSREQASTAPQKIAVRPRGFPHCNTADRMAAPHNSPLMGTPDFFPDDRSKSHSLRGKAKLIRLKDQSGSKVT